MCSSDLNSGQTCACLKRLYVHDSIYEDVCRELAAFSKNITIGDGLSESSILGPVQNERQFEIVSTFVEDAKQRGGRILTGGTRTSGPGYFYPITLVADVDHGCLLVDQEQFGPALPIIRYHDVEESRPHAPKWTESWLVGQQEVEATPFPVQERF